MNKLKEPVIYTIEGTAFVVDIDKQVLRQSDNPANEISFVRDMTDQGSHYRLFYDPDPSSKPPGTYNPDALKEFIIPKLIELDPDGMAAKYRYRPEELKNKTDFQIIVDQELLAQRHQGVLPKINIAGEEFVVDLRLQELRHAQSFHPVLSLNSFELTSDGRHYDGYYHPVIRQLVPLDPKLTELPDSVIKIKIPNEIGLDPVGAARIYGVDERELLRRYPIQRDLKAEIIPLSETHIPSLIRQNREQLQKEHRENAQKIKPRFRPKF
ncbi:hypothetical protein ACPPVU_12820 [Mucilaginibacter sp. McL0603]|uniref:hypothetical protein n=1 Tax=Mucilaginibacter sp. McL0603 TaxID=3415670 RepID=UPI003CED3A68